ncbi:LL-diaminopimelate aminotransferase [Clostridium vitabionis]|uniref:LL-diaminopimelate aminotransferase n=1 Tax=Clostridium vitabionis TaxID=2784388 RepID=UPI00188AAD0C|nr:LL-diaminopimelate aminotransferase [Clostridium vitabionis]
MAAKINANFNNISESYLFARVNQLVREFQEQHPDREIIRMGIGDVTRPLAAKVVEALKAASDEQGKQETFHGYGPEQGYDFLKEAVRGYYKRHGVDLELNEIFISDGAKSDCGNLMDLFSIDNTVLVPDPVYPVYVDTNVMAGRKIIYADANEQNHFLPLPDESQDADIIYICSPNNPTGAAYSREQLKAWVDYANRRGSIIFFDAAYECFVTGDMPRSIYEIEGAKTCAVEICSFSKKAGFTGTRCGYTVVPMDLVRDGHAINKMWLRRQTTKFNGTAYIIQRGAAAVFTPEGEAECEANLEYYRGNAKVITDTLDRMGIFYTGGVYSPYIWLKCPGDRNSWDFFSDLLEKTGVVGTPGAGFGKNGEKFFRLTAFSTRENTEKAMKKFYEVYGRN